MTVAATIGVREQAAMILDGDERARVELRAVHPRLRQVRQDWYRLEQLDELARYASTLAPSYDVWLGGAPRARRGGTAADVAWSAMPWADCDGAEAVAALTVFEPRPTLVVRSSTLADEGEHQQAWWHLDRRLGAEELEPVLRRLAAALGSDTSVCDRARVLRAVGTTNHKRATPEPIEVISCTGELHELRELLEALPAREQADERARKPGRGVMPEVDRVPPGQMYEHLTDLAVRLARAGILQADVIERMLVCEFEAARAPGANYGDRRAGERDTRGLAEWAAKSRIAKRERAWAELPAGSWWRRPPEREVVDA